MIIRWSKQVPAGKVYGNMVSSTDAPPPAWHLFDLEKDIGEQRNIAKEHREIVGELAAHFDKWRSAMHPSIEQPVKGNLS